MKWVDIGIAFVFLSNGLFLILMGALAWRLLHHTKRSRDELADVANHLRGDAGRIARHANEAAEMFGGIRGDLTKMLDAVRHGTQAAAAAPPDPYQAWAGRDPQGLDQLLGEQSTMLEEVSKVEPQHFSAWRDRHRGELERVLAQKYRLQTELENLKQSNDEAQRHVRELQLRQRATQAASTENAQLKVELDRLRGDLEMARDKARKQEQRSNALAQDLEKAFAGQGATTVDTGRAKDLEAKLANAEVEKAKLNNQLRQIQESLKRTLTEKDFIEERFLQLDSAMPAAGAAPPPAPTSAPKRPQIIGGSRR
jgi:uncharacterized coiled-coil protein SlyX/regulator of replication initiation timing